MPTIPFNPVAIGAAAVVIFFFSYLWYSPLFGRAWNRAMGLPPEYAHQGADLARGLLLTALGAVLMAMVLSSTMAVWLPQSWGLPGPGPGAVEQVLSAAGFTWLGFVLPVLLHRMGWEKPSLPLLAIHGGYYLVALLLGAAVLRVLR
jgi:hypothetical protein